ncbi:MAG TPA: signal peptidase I [Aggregatilineales bacterium]|nr:signal peptidase I [Aggregatilineales bacterium]
MFDGTFPEYFPDIESLDLVMPREVHPMLVPRRVRFHAETLLIVIAIYTAVNLVTARYVVEGPSMEPNFVTGQAIVVNRLAYWFGRPTRGDVVVFHNPEDPSHEFIKRVIGLPGDTIRIEDGTVVVNGKVLEEPYVKSLCSNHRCDNAWTLDGDHYFVLGDNRNQSRDGHNFGPLDRTLIVGLAWVRYWPPADWGLIASYTH